MTDSEYSREYWERERHNPVYVLELENGCQIFASRDYEGNGGGALFGYNNKTNKGFTIAIDRNCPKQPVNTSHLNNEEFGEYIKKNCK